RASCALRPAISCAAARACTSATSSVKSCRTTVSAPQPRCDASALSPWPTRTPTTNVTTPAANETAASAAVTRPTPPPSRRQSVSVPRLVPAGAGRADPLLGQPELDDLDQALEPDLGAGAVEERELLDLAQVEREAEHVHELLDLRGKALP